MDMRIHEPVLRLHGLVAWLSILFLTATVSTAPADQADAYWHKGEELYEAHHLAPGRFEEALAYYEKAVALRPGDYRFLWELSKRYQIYGQTLGEDQRRQKLKAWKKGARHGRRAVDAEPNGKEGHFYYMANLGAIAQLKGTLDSLWRFPKIRNHMENALRLDPDWPPALLAKAQYLMEIPGLFGGDKEEARSLLQRVVELDPDHLPTYVALARLLTLEGRYEEALASLDKVLLCEKPRHVANYVKVDRPRAEAVRDEIMKKRSVAR
jgi:tetratricopeptide (TPR) repeat protein